MSDMDRIQQDAMRRMQEMQSRAKIPQKPQGQQQQNQQHQGQPVPQHTQQQNHQKQRQNAPAMPVPQRETPPARMPEEKNHIQPQPPLGDLLDGIFEDKERNLILILILLLSSEGADTGLILAMMYLII